MYKAKTWKAYNREQRRNRRIKALKAFFEVLGYAVASLAGLIIVYLVLLAIVITF